MDIEILGRVGKTLRRRVGRCTRAVERRGWDGGRPLAASGQTFTEALTGGKPPPMLQSLLVRSLIRPSGPPPSFLMYNTILVPVDLSDSNERVLGRAVALGNPDRSTITLLHVIEMVEDIPLDEDEDFYAELRDNADAKMSGWAGEVADHGFEVTAEVTYGKRAQEIVRVADASSADLIVMRSHVIDPDEDTSRERLGTVSHQVALFAPCSVLVVREETTADE